MTVNKSSSLLCQAGLSSAQSSFEVSFKATVLLEFLLCQNDAVQSLSQEEKVFQVLEEIEHGHLTQCRMHFSSEDLLSPNAYAKKIQHYVIKVCRYSSFLHAIYHLLQPILYIFFCFPLSQTCLGNNLTPNNNVTVFSIHNCSCLAQDLSTFLFLGCLPAKKSLQNYSREKVCVQGVSLRLPKSNFTRYL